MDLERTFRLSRIAVVALACMLPVLLAPAAVGAQDDDARTLFQRGQAAYAQGDYDGAIAQWSRAYVLDPRPLLQFNLSQAYERLGRLTDAITALETYLQRADPTDERQADARARLASLRERLARTSIRFSGGPEGATILIDGEDRGRTPRPDPIQLPPGAHRIIVRADGHEDFRANVVVPAGQTIEVAIEMQAAAASTSGAATATQDGGGSVPVAPIVLFSVGGAALITGAILGGVALSQAEGAPSRTSSEAESARGLALGADITLGVGAACAIAGLVVLLVELGNAPSNAETEPAAETPSASLTPWGGPDSAGLAISGRL